MTRPPPSGELRVYVRHIRAAKLCTHGARNWFVMRELDWNAFLTEGLSAEFLRGLDDPISNRALAAAEAEAAMLSEGVTDGRR